MTLQAARKLQAEIRESGIYCAVPMGGKERGPRRFACRICTSIGNPSGAGRPVEFGSRKAWLAYKIGMDERERERQRQSLIHDLRSRPRSPIEMMVDQACGLA